MGYLAGVVGTRTGGPNRRRMVWGDLLPPHEDVGGTGDWRPLIRPGNAPADFLGEHQKIQGGYTANYGGPGATHAYLTVRDRTMLSVNDAPLVNTAITDMPVGANTGDPRLYQGKDATHPTDPLFYAVGMGHHGTKVLRNGAAGPYETPAWIPIPSHPNPGPSPTHHSGRYTLFAVDPDNPERIAVAPCGEGVLLSNDRLATGAKISPVGLDAVTCMEFRAGKLHVLIGSTTGVAGAILPNNWRVFDPAAGTWTQVLNAEPFLFFMPDPRGPNWWYCVKAGGEWSHTKDLATWKHWVDQGNPIETPRHLIVGNYRQTRPTRTPMVALKYQGGQGTGSPGRPRLIEGEICLPLGYGFLTCPLADAPTEGADLANTHHDSAWFDWTEKGRGLEMLAPQSVFPAGDVRVKLGQDVAFVTSELPGSGHRTNIRYHPKRLTNGTGGSVGLNPNFIVGKATKNGPPYIFHSLDNGKTWQHGQHQPPIVNAAGDGGMALAGNPGEIFCFPTLGAAPTATDDLGATEYRPVRFFLLNGTEIDPSQFGMGGAGFANNHHVACHDLGNPGTLYMLMPNYAPGTQPGLYRRANGDGFNFRQIWAGQACPPPSGEFYDCQLVADGLGNLFWVPTWWSTLQETEAGTPGANAENKTALFNVSGSTVTYSRLPTPYDIRSVGIVAPLAPDRPRCALILGWIQGVFGTWLLEAPYTGTPIGPFAGRGPAGTLTYANGHKTRPGEFYAAHGGRDGAEAGGFAVGRLMDA